MISAFLLSMVVSYACASISPIVIIPSTSTTTLLRTPQHDSAIVRSERLGGNFAYAVAEGQAFRAVPPVISSVSSEISIENYLHKLRILLVNERIVVI